jgi:hypothetical protein
MEEKNIITRIGLYFSSKKDTDNKIVDAINKKSHETQGSKISVVKAALVKVLTEEGYMS